MDGRSPSGDFSENVENASKLKSGINGESIIDIIGRL
jgi:hypothetical protein